MSIIPPFISYQEQIGKLSNEKELVITDVEYAIAKLKDYSYFGLISCYKEPFYNKTAKKYKRNTSFEQIINLFEFDMNLRELFLKELLY